MSPAFHDMCLLYIPGILESASSVRGATGLQSDDTKNLGTQAFIDLGEKMGCHFERKQITRLKDGGTLEFHVANIHLKM